VTNTNIIYGSQDESFTNSLIEKVQDFVEIAPYFNSVPVITEEDQNANITVVTETTTTAGEMEIISNPFYSFYEEALQLVDEL
jgi:glutamine amidotransferase PdxT